MRIVHYTLGLYPRRAGGLNHYATDLMLEQAKNHDVIALLPGKCIFFTKKCSIRNGNKVLGISCYTLENALPQPLMYGIKHPTAFMSQKISKRSFQKFYTNVKPDVLHIHTLMGLSEEVLQFFKEQGVKIVYTSHDYFGICPKVNLINQENVLCEGPSPGRCADCNKKAPTTLFLRLRNSAMAFKTRDFVRWLRNTLHF